MPEGLNISVPEALSPTLQEVSSMALHYSADEFKERAASENASKEITEDATLTILTLMIKGKYNVPQGVDLIRRFLSRDSMQDNPKSDLFRRAAQELADKEGYKVTV